MVVPNNGYFTDAQTVKERDINEFRIKGPIQCPLSGKNDVRGPGIEHFETAGEIFYVSPDAQAG